MGTGIAQILEKIKRFRTQLFDFSHSKKNEPKKTVEVKALAVRGAATPSDEGMFCRIVYGNKKVKTVPLSNGEAADWKENIVVSAYSPSGFIIECWRKKPSGGFKKFLGRIVIAQKELEESPNGKIRAWFTMIGKRNKNHKITGRLFVSLVVPDRQIPEKEHLQPTNEVPVHTVNIETPPKPVEQYSLVVDRLAELRPDLKNDPQVREETLPSEFRQRTDAIDRIIKTVDNQLKSLEIKLKLLEKRGANPFLKQEIKTLFQDIDDILEAGTKRIKQMGADLNATHDKDLTSKMLHFNDALGRLMSRTDEFNRVKDHVIDTRVLVS
jgi:predicted DNA-binding protein YlxM (UPF0122 family)